MATLRLRSWLVLPVVLAFSWMANPLPAQEEPPHHAHHALPAAAGQGAPLPREAGQGAFAAIQEIVVLLQADPATDWSRVNIRALREHLVDMNEVTVHAEVAEKLLPNGLEAEATGEGRVLAAIERMVPAHAGMLGGYSGWQVAATRIEKGVRLRVTSDNPDEVRQIQGLGFFGIMASGAHHQAHHLMLAKGEMPHG
ncbi:MAG: hypothetical protein ACLGQH_02865 [Acidobacteriota bacterium]